jgi:chloramphenicol O-acetyltransferase
MKAASTYETSVKVYHTTRRNNPENNHLHFIALFLHAITKTQWILETFFSFALKKNF